MAILHQNRPCLAAAVLAVALAGAWAAPAPVSAQAAGMPATATIDRGETSRIVRAGRQARLTVRLQGVASCRLSGFGLRGRAATTGMRAVRFLARIHRRARSGRYRLTIRCGRTKLRHTLRVRGTSKGMRRIAAGRVAVRRIRERRASSDDVPAPPAPDVGVVGEPRFGAHVPGAPEGGVQGVDALASDLRRPVDIVLWYQHWEGWGTEPRLDWVRNVTASGRTPLLTWEPWAAPADGVPGDADQPEFALREIAAGRYDAYIQRWAAALASLGTPVYLRPMHEMNGDWYPWGGTVNGNTADDYVAAWRHLHDIFRRSGAENVRWVWAPYASDVPAVPANAFERYYPGHEYVDVLALDGYNWGAEMPQYGGWQSFDAVFARAYARIAALGPQPVWIAETASDAVGGDKAAWVRDMLSSRTRFPRIDAVVWFHVKKERDWRATSPAGAAAAFALP